MIVRSDMKKLNREWWFTLFHIRIRRKQMKTYFDYTFHTELWNWLPKVLVGGNGFRKQTHLDTDIQLYSVLALLSPCHLLLSPFRRKVPNFGFFYLAHNSWFCVLYCTSKDWCILHLLLEASEVLFQELFCMFWTSFPTVPSSSEVNLTFRAVGGFQFQCNFWTMQYFTLNFLQDTVLSYFAYFMILGLSQKCLQCWAT